VQFNLFADRDNDPRSKFYALYTLAIIHPLDSERTNFFGRFFFLIMLFKKELIILAISFEFIQMHLGAFLRITLEMYLGMRLRVKLIFLMLRVLLK
jgi:hypothetical protein